MILNVIGDVIWFFLPALVANMAPVLVSKTHWLEQLHRPLDGGRTWRGRRLLGDHKTVRGLLVGVVFGFLVGLLQHVAARLQIAPLSPFFDYYPVLWPALLGAWLGLAALAGDAVKSLVKRQLNIAPGKAWRPWDQIDFILAALVFTCWFISYTLLHIVVAIIISGIISYGTSALGVALRLKKNV
jgi:CDP-2,3-bis-(O-geranylgeranyl)-sn-glycerol synthase